MKTPSNTGFDDVLSPGTQTLREGDATPSKLLQARYGIVPWHDAGRSELLAELDAWADDASQPVAAWLLHAEGGAGKTRLAIEWIRRRRARYEVAGFLDPGAGDQWLARLTSQEQPVIIVIDYAESRPGLAAELRKLVKLGVSSDPHPRFRVLLLARSDGDWWTELLKHDPELEPLLEKKGPRKLAPLASTTANRQTVLDEAVRAFAGFRGLSPAPVPNLSLEDALFSRALYLHMAALLAVERARPSTPGDLSLRGSTIETSSVLDEVLDHEERYWASKSTERGQASTLRSIARQVVAAATLRGGLQTEWEAGEVLARVTGRPRTPSDDQLLALLRDIYKRDSIEQYLPGLEPDLLGEGMALRLARPPKKGGTPVDDDWIERAAAADDNASAITTAFIVLGRASVAHPDATRPWMARLLRKDLEQRALLALRAAKAVGTRTAHAAIGDVLTEALEGAGSPAIAHALDVEGIPRPSVSLARVAAWQSRTMLGEHSLINQPSDADAMAARAFWLDQRGGDLSALGQRETALAASQESVFLYRALADKTPDVFLPDLARSLNNLGVILRTLGQREAALAATQEAVSLYRALADKTPDAFLPYLAHSLNSLGIQWSALGQHQDALAATQKAVSLYRALADKTPDDFLPDLAKSLNNLGIRWSELGQHQDALAASQEAVSLYRALADKTPDAFLPDLAHSLNNLGIRWSELGQHQDALVAGQETVSLYRALADKTPDTFLPDLALSLNNLGIRWSELGQHQDALAASQEAVSLYRALADKTPGAFLPYLAHSVDNLGIRWSELGQHQLALAATQEAVSLYRPLADKTPDAFLPDLARSLNNLGIDLSALGRDAEGDEAMREAATLEARSKTSRQP